MATNTRFIWVQGEFPLQTDWTPDTESAETPVAGISSDDKPNWDESWRGSFWLELDLVLELEEPEPGTYMSTELFPFQVRDPLGVTFSLSSDIWKVNDWLAKDFNVIPRGVVYYPYDY